MDPPHRRPRRHRAGRGRHRGLAAAGRGGRADPRGDAGGAAPRARGAVRRRRVRDVRPHPALGGGGGLVADRAVRAGPDGRAARRVRALLPLDRPRRPRLLPRPARTRLPATPSTRWRSSPGTAARPTSRPVRWPRCRSSATCCGASWTASTGPTRSDRDDGTLPKLAPHVRLRFDATRNQSVLLGPESVAVLNRTSADILELCDGRRTARRDRRRAADAATTGWPTTRCARSSTGWPPGTTWRSADG